MPQSGPRQGDEIFILGGAENITLNTLVGMIAALVGGRVSRLRVPLRPIEWASRVCEGICKPLGIEPPLHPRRVGFFTVNRASTSARPTAYWGTPPRAVAGRSGPHGQRCRFPGDAMTRDNPGE